MLCKYCMHALFFPYFYSFISAFLLLKFYVLYLSFLHLNLVIYCTMPILYLPDQEQVHISPEGWYFRDASTSDTAHQGSQREQGNLSVSWLNLVNACGPVPHKLVQLTLTSQHLTVLPCHEHADWLCWMQRAQNKSHPTTTLKTSICPKWVSKQPS